MPGDYAPVLDRRQLEQDHAAAEGAYRASIQAIRVAELDLTVGRRARGEVTAVGYDAREG